MVRGSEFGETEWREEGGEEREGTVAMEGWKTPVQINMFLSHKHSHCKHTEGFHFLLQMHIQLTRFHSGVNITQQTRENCMSLGDTGEMLKIRNWKQQKQ